MEKVKNIIGSVAEGNDFIGREKELQQAIELLEDGNNLILAAPRRVGKTSFSRKLKDELEKKNWKCFYIDLQKAPSEFDFIKLFSLEIKGETWLEKFIPDIDKIAIGQVSLEITSKKQDYYERIESHLPHDQDTIIIFDEVIVFIEDALRKKKGEINEFENVIHFLNRLRGLRQKSGSKIRWIFCSSISIEYYLQKYNLTKTINDFTSFALGELTIEESHKLIKALSISKQIKFHDEQITYMLEMLSWKLPYFIQILFKEINEIVRELTNKIVTNEIINNAYHYLLDNTISFNTWEERLSYYEEDKRLAKIVLNRLSCNKNGMNINVIVNILSSEIFNEEIADNIVKSLLKHLENDGYIV